MSSARVVAVCLGPGGIPKRPVESAVVGPRGLAGDGHRQEFHGGPKRAVCLLSTADYASLEADGVATDGPGTFGENLLIDGLDFASLRPDDELLVGDEVVLAIEDVRAPCGTLKQLDRRFPELMLGRSGFVCRVVAGGRVLPGDAVRARPAP